MKNVYLIMLCFFTFSVHSQAEWSEFKPSYKNISALIALACSIDADKSLHDSHTDNGLFFHEFRVDRNLDQEWIATGTCRMVVDSNKAVIAGDEVKFKLKPADLDKNSYVIEGQIGDWSIEYKYGYKEGAEPKGSTFLTPKTILDVKFYFSASLSGYLKKLAGLLTPIQYNVQERTSWATSGHSDLELRLLSDRNGGILDQFIVRSQNTQSIETVMVPAAGPIYGNGIFYETAAYAFRGCTYFRSNNNSVYKYLDESTCRNYWNQIHKP